MIRGLPTWSKRAYSRSWRSRAEVSGELLYVALGDSAAQGLGATGPDLGYVGLLADLLAQESGRTVRVVNLAVSGAKIADVVASQLLALRALSRKSPPDLVTVDAGGNDIRQFDEKSFAASAAALISALPINAIVADVPCFWGGKAEQRALLAARIMRDLAREHALPIAELHRVTEERRNARTRGDFALDMFHPSDAGYRIWASAFAPAVTARGRELRP